MLPSLLKKILQSAEFKNISWLVMDKLWRMGISLFVGVWVIRYLGPEQFGTINYVLAYIGIGLVVANMGMESFLIKELNFAPAKRESIIRTAWQIRVAVVGVVALLLLILLCVLQESKLSFFLFFLLVPQLLTSPFAVVDLAYQAELKAKVVVVFRNASFVLGAVLKVLAIYTHQDIYVFALLTGLDIVLGDLLLFFYFKKKHPDFSFGAVDKSFVAVLAKKSVPFVLSNVAIVFYMKVDQILLGKFSTAAEVGFFTAATKISELFYFIPLVITGSIYKLLINNYKTNYADYIKTAQKVFFYFLLAATLISAVVCFMSDWLVLLLFGSEFSATVPVLQLYIWALVFIFGGVAFGQLLVIEEMQQLILYKTLIGIVLNIVLNILLIPAYGALGAAGATLVTQFVSSILANLFFPASRKLFLQYFSFSVNRING